MKGRKALLGLGGLLVLLFVLQIFARIYVRYNWFGVLGYTNLFTTPILIQIILFVTSGIFYFFFIRYAIVHAIGVYEKARKEYIDIRNPMDIPFLQRKEQLNVINLKHLKKPALFVSVLFSLILSVTFAAEGWMKVMEFLKAEPFGLKEQVFNMDVSFYLFRMPLLEFLLEKIGGIILPVFFFTALFYFLTGLITFNPRTNPKFSMYVGIRKWLGTLLSLSFIVLAFNNFVSIFSTMYSQEGYVYGAGFTDIHAGIPAALVLTVVAIIAAISSLMYRRKQNFKFLSYPIIIYVGIFLLGTVAQVVVQYSVSNNEFVNERPYIEQEIMFTRQAYGLNNIVNKEYTGDAVLSYADLMRNTDTLDNARLNDPEPLQEVISQQQGLRYYYRFNDIDVDRYDVDGKLREVLLSPREISQSALTEKAGTFINLTMRYTHGYGLVGTFANEMNRNGYANLILRDIPPVTQVESLNTNEPRIYFGELTNDTEYGYVIAGSKTMEFDYPKGDNNMENSYDGSGGLTFGGINKLMLSLYFSTLRFYVTGEIDDNSKLLMIRDIEDRVRELTPFLAFDQDPYLVVREDGSLSWILDAYTYKTGYPYASPYGDLNYIRNAVKVTIDPYNGNVDFYVFDSEDPVIRTYAKIFPDVFQPKENMPEDLLSHVRYPEDFYTIQSNMLLNYHVEDPSVFYNKEDTWSIAKKALAGGLTENIQPYYAVMALPDNPDRKDTEFLLKMPFTPASRGDQPRNNMVAWMAARCDGEHYGELMLYKLPKSLEIQGPLMIDSLIDQDTEISGKLSLWDKSGSNVIRGNLITLPMEGGFIYIEPIYLKAEREGSSIPQMQAIVFAVGKELIMVETNELDEAIEAFFLGQVLDQPTVPTEPTEPGAPIDTNRLRTLVEDLKGNIQELEDLLDSLDADDANSQEIVEEAPALN
ncbi:UPF0182 family protein [Clostridia bacterium]|nr:UPF0182 family protein [Clostridia bacterium]